MRAALALALGIALAANGLLMLFDPAGWYGLVPGVPETGPFNPHFVRDIGCAYLVAGVAWTWFALEHFPAKWVPVRRRKRDQTQNLEARSGLIKSEHAPSGPARAAALAGGAFLVLHALVHVADAVAGRGGHHPPAELAAVFAPAVIALWLAAVPAPTSRRHTMLKWLLKRRIAAFERTYNYDASYVRDILDADVSAAMAYGKVMGLGAYRKDVPKEAYYAAGLTGTLAEDCGPCTQLGVSMAEREGVSPAVLRAILAGDVNALTPDAALGLRFARATLAHDPAADGLREEIVRRWGKRALVSLAFAVTAARIYPTTKYALGHGQACRRIVVGGTTMPVLREAA
ncbi:MAG TPA: hypothetical protein VHA77_03260 [Xanthobacteraceae bacterium]|jgi:hypothetical protein|nr:hypothetical protein [Xanthobacteraceae bacterium]